MELSSYPPPRLIFWETTAGCNLACIHCRRMTVADQLLPQDLKTEEAFSLIDQVAAFARPIFVLSGGEPLFRPDIFDIARHATKAGLIVALATNGTLIDREVAQKIKDSGIRRVSISFDGADAATHNIFRGPTAFERSIKGMEHLAALDVPYQINTTVARHNSHQMPETLALAKGLGAQALHLFLLVPVGCGMEIADDQQIKADEYEKVLNWMYDAEMEGGIELKATCAPHYFRIVRQRQAEERRLGIVRERPDSHRRQQHAGGHTGASRRPSRRTSRWGEWEWQRERPGTAGDERREQGLPGRHGRLLCEPPRRGVPLRLPAGRGGQHPPAAVPRDLGKFAAVYRAAQPRPAGREVRAVRV